MPFCERPWLASRGAPFARRPLDTTFGVGGRVMTSINIDAEAHAAFVLFNQSILVAGRSGVGANANSTIVRYDPLGAIDPTFGTAGVAVIDVGALDELLDITGRSDGMIFAVGRTSSDVLIMRLDSNGTPDATFGGTGIVTTILARAPTPGLQFSSTSRGSTSSRAAAAATSPFSATTPRARWMGRSAPAAWSRRRSLAEVNHFALARYHTNGALDTSFGTAGLTMTDMGGAEQARGGVIDSTGRFIAGGFRLDPFTGASVFALAGYNPSGVLDPTFGKGGTVTTKVTPTGGIDHAFGKGGKTLTDDTFERANGAASLGDGRVITVGLGNGAFAMARYAT